MRFLVAILFCWSCVAATITTRVVREDGTGHYTSLAGWESGRQADLTASDSIELASIEGSWINPDTAALTIDGWTTDATRYICITNSTSKHTGKWTATGYVLQDGSSSQCIYTGESYIRIYGIQIYGTRGGTQYGIRIAPGTTSAHHIGYVLCKFAAGTASSNYRGIQCTDSSATSYVFNSIFYDCDDAFSDGRGFAATAGTHYIYNCTFQNCDGTALVGNSTTYVKNCLFTSNGASTSGLTAANCNYNSTSNSGLGYTASANDRVSQTFTFVDAAGDDFHLGSADAGAKDYGVSDPGSGLFADDIDYVARSGSWDIGADEYVAAATSAGQIIIIRQQ